MRPVAALVALLAALLLTACQSSASVTAATSAAASTGSSASVSTGSATKAASKAASPSSSASGKSSTQRLAPAKATTSLPTVKVSQLPPEAVTTLTLIAAGGPYPYSRDGVVFENREGILPKQKSGYYHEYTVVTPGSSDRGARRIITGADGQRFYTDDHYDSFREVIQP